MPESAVIFDIGNVLIRWDVRLLYRQLLPDDAAIDAFLAEVGFHAWNLEFDRGADWDAGVAALSARHPRHAALIAAFHARWHETVPGAIAGSVAILEALAAAGVPLFAITNFSAPKWEETVARFPFLGTAFRDVVVSGREGVLKPDPAIYRLCLARNGLDPARAIFIDDSAANVAGAAAVGLDAICFTGPEALGAGSPVAASSPERCRLTSRNIPSAPSPNRQTSATGSGAATSGATAGASAASPPPAPRPAPGRSASCGSGSGRAPKGSPSAAGSPPRRRRAPPRAAQARPHRAGRGSRRAAVTQAAASAASAAARRSGTSARKPPSQPSPRRSANGANPAATSASAASSAAASPAAAGTAASASRESRSAAAPRPAPRARPAVPAARSPRPERPPAASHPSQAAPKRASALPSGGAK